MLALPRDLLDLFRGIAGAQLEAATMPVDPTRRDGAAVLERRPDGAQETVQWLLDPEPRSPQDRGPGNPVYSGAGWGVPVPCGEDG